LHCRGAALAFYEIMRELLGFFVPQEISGNQNQKDQKGQDVEELIAVMEGFTALIHRTHF